MILYGDSARYENERNRPGDDFVHESLGFSNDQELVQGPYTSRDMIEISQSVNDKLVSVELPEVSVSYLLGVRGSIALMRLTYDSGNYSISKVGQRVQHDGVEPLNDEQSRYLVRTLAEKPFDLGLLTELSDAVNLLESQDSRDAFDGFKAETLYEAPFIVRPKRQADSDVYASEDVSNGLAFELLNAAHDRGTTLDMDILTPGEAHESIYKKILLANLFNFVIKPKVG